MLWFYLINDKSMSKRTIFLVLAFKLIVFSIRGQKLPLQVDVFMPQVLQEQILKQTDAESLLKDPFWGQKKAVKNKRYWVVYSDRSDNAAYNTPSSSSMISNKLDFNQKVRIAQIKNGFALVYEDNLNEYPNISKFAKVLGWVPMNKLLLWSSCPTNESGIYYKALISANISGTTRNKKNDFFNLYKNPEAKSSEKIAPSMDFYFIMKRLDNNMVLLSNECRMDGTNSQVLTGWVGETTYVPWNQRSCLEPNWMPDDVKQFNARKEKVHVALDEKQTREVLTFSFGIDNGIGKTEYERYRMSQHVLRFPILDYQSKDAYKCQAFGTTGGSIEMAIELQKKLKEIQEKASENVRNMNLIICIDGTKSMEPYFPAVKQAISDAMKYVPADLKFKVGLVIYRDYSDGNGLVEYLPLVSPKDARIAGFLDKGGKYGIKSSAADRTHVEALYKGIEVAIDPKKMGFTKEQSNFLLVVGDCGNDENDKRCLSSAEIISRMIKNNVQLMSFQVYRKNDYAWSLFNDQMSSMIQQNVKTRYMNLGTGVKVTYDELKDGYELNSKNSEQIYLGSIRYGRLNEQMPAARLTELITASVNRFIEYIEKQEALIGTLDGIDPNAINTKSGQDDVLAKTNVERLREIVGDEAFNLLDKTNAIFAYVGYTPKADAQKREYWKPVIFISSDEFGELVEKLEPVNKAAQHKSNDRTPYVNAMKGILRAMLPDITENEMNAKGVQEIMNLITGLNVSTKAIKGPTLMQIQDPKSVNQQQYLSIINAFKTKYDKLRKIKSRGYDFVFKSNGIKYYWIPVQELP